MTEFVSVNEAAEELRVQPRTVRDYIRSGRLRAARIGKQYRIRVEDLQLFAGGAVPRADVGAAVAALPGGRPAADQGVGASLATVILDIDTRDAASAERVTTLVASRGFGAGVDVHLSTIAGSSVLKVVLTGAVGGVLDTAAAVRRVLELTHD